MLFLDSNNASKSLETDFQAEIGKIRFWTKFICRKSMQKIFAKN